MRRLADPSEIAELVAFLASGEYVRDRARHSRGRRLLVPVSGSLSRRGCATTPPRRARRDLSWRARREEEPSVRRGRERLGRAPRRRAGGAAARRRGAVAHRRGDQDAGERRARAGTRLMQRSAKRNMTIVSIGGGICQDITGFVASTLYRGIGWVFLPTTLLAQADSCIGSKTSLNYKPIQKPARHVLPTQRGAPVCAVSHHAEGDRFLLRARVRS